MIYKKFVILCFLLLLSRLSLACDLCGCFMPPGETGKGFQLGFAEQYSSLSDLYLNGVKLPNTLNQYMDSSYSQVMVNYRFNPQYSLQLNIPLIYRSFQRVEGDALQTGTESGIGDMLLVGTYVPFQRKNPMAQFRWKVIGGLKFPTGSADRISEELTEMDSGSGSVPSAVHGHDLALGSGSWDGLIGSEVSGGTGRWYYLGHLQYAIRTRGSFDYKYANDLLWYGGPGYYLARGHNYTFGLQGQFGGEHKGADELGSQKTEDTALTTVSFAPTAMIGIKNVVMAEIGFGFPLYVDNSSLQTVTKYRLRVGLTWQFQ